MAFVNEPENERTIDYERNAIFKRGGNLGLPPARMPPHAYFTLIWKGKKVTILSYTRLENVSEKGGELYHYIDMCDLDEELRPYRGEIRDMLVEALKVFGILYGTAPGQTVKVDVKINPALGNLNPAYDFETQTIKPTTH